jgi:hypothetical protein
MRAAERVASSAVEEQLSGARCTSPSRNAQASKLLALIWLAKKKSGHVALGEQKVQRRIDCGAHSLMRRALFGNLSTR